MHAYECQIKACENDLLYEILNVKNGYRFLNPSC
jgi:hypothetical protein